MTSGSQSQSARPDFKNLGRAIAYLGRYRGVAIAAYAALLLSIGAQLLVPQLVQNILDAVTRGMMAQQLAQAPAAAQAAALHQAGMSAAELQSIL
ncbi:MAG: ABC transporter ATP-binding protein, partial [Candidatus Thermofonsia Clade 3 bacterium]